MSKITQLATKIYEWTDTTFTKREYAESDRQRDVHGKPIIWKFGPRRLENEYNALKLIAVKTTIPVPEVVKFGEDDNGAMFLAVQRIDGIEYAVAGDECRMPVEKRHVAGGPCATCQSTADINVEAYITTVVLPQLKQLRSDHIGLAGLVLPPPRILEYDNRDVWSPRQSSKADGYVFCHGDLARHNIMLDPQDLKVKCIYDWEHAGFYPPSLELALWRMSYDEYMSVFEDKDMIEREISLIE
jgi:hypothetical protein